MVNENINLICNNFEGNTSNTFRQLWNDRDFTDVTLATADDKQIQVHRVVLRCCSDFFKHILIKNPHQNPLIYFKDIRHKYLEMLMQFIYLGQCEVVREELDQFLKVGKELQISELMEIKYPEDNQLPQNKNG